MALHDSQKVLFETGSFSGYRPLRELGSGYLSSSAFKQPLCGNEEGWGPMSPHRFDFTPCFIDVWIAAVAVFGLFIGSLAVWWLTKKQQNAAQSKTTQFYIKQILLAVIIADIAVQLAIQIINYPGIWFGDFRVWTTALTILSMFVIFTIQWLEHSRIRYPSGVALFYWLLLLLAFAVKLRSLISQQLYDTNLPYFITYCVGVGLSLVEFLVEWLWPRSVGPDGYDAIEEEEECPVEYANVFSQLTFSWMTPLMQYGYKVFLTEDDLWSLAKSDQTKTTGTDFDKAWQHQLETRKEPSLWLALFGAYGGPYCVAAIYKIGNDVSQYIQPQLLRLLITFVASYEKGETPQPVIKGAAIALAMFGCAVFQTTMIHQYFQLTFVTGMRIKGGLGSAIYRKSLRLSNEGRSSKSTGDIVNYMAVDAQRLQDLTQFAQQAWSAPFQIAICMISLYNLVGWSMMAGIVVMIVMMPIQGFVARIMKNMQKDQMKNKDARSRLINEIINNMKSIKLYAWGSAFMNKLNHVRNEQELKNLRKIGATQAFANFTWTTAPFFVSCSTFTVFVLTQDRPLTTEIVFPALALFNLLTFPLAVLPMVITAIVEASVAVGRLTGFLTAEELQPNAITVKPAPEELGEETVIIRDGTFSWNRHEDRNALKDIHFTAYKGELSCIVGRVGAGKSSFLQSILGDLWKVKGSVEVRGTVAYASQQTWILNATVKENIIFGYRYDPEFYEKTIQACALLDDFAQLPDGDETVVGERGISLSGGQKARVSLARAVYARADIYLLDDVLSAVDSHVGRHIIDNVLGPRGLLSSKTRILATNAIAVLRGASFVTLIKDGEVIEKGTYKQLIAMKGLVADLLKTAGHDSGSSDNSEPTSSASSSKATTIIEPDSSQAKEEMEEAQERVPEMAPIKTGPSLAKPRSNSMATLRRASTATFQGPRGKLTDEEVAGSSKTKQAKEFVEQGKVKWSVYWEYAKENNIYAVGLYLLMLLAAQSASMGGSFWLRAWAEHNKEAGGNDDIGKYIGIYFAIGIGSSALTVIQTLILWIFCSIEASRKLHERMANAIFRSPMSFFDTTPAGRILNRFSSDIYRVDEVLARTFNMLFVNAARSGFTLAVISVAMPPFVALIIPLGLTYYWIQRYYLRTSRELKRLDSVTRSPIYAHFQESLGGISTIRAYRQQQRFELENEWRVDANLRAYFPSISANRWLAVRLEFIGAIVILAAAGFAVIEVASGVVLKPGAVGLAMSYALQITTSLNWIVRQTVEVETNIVSVERVLEYAALPSEAPEIIADRRPSVSWPAKGEVDFVNYSTRYREGLDLVLKNVNLDIKSHEKIGVVGRTGAGKSSLTLALFRLIEPVTGHIGIDDLNTSSIGLLDLRRRLAIIPQDAALFEGTVRDNLDPGHVRDDTELWSVLEHARLKDHITSLEGGLEAKINEGGSNLSQGQRQLVSLARAMLTPSNILVLDEATAAVDIETDALLQDTLRSPLFANRTIITVAHRLNTILDSDRVVVLDKGEVVEFDTPSELFKKQGVFHGLMKQAGLEIE
ncbi:P-loop containing nucleoside triphosphate hydrolase protein [Ilyonectria robusta]|uniref:P-loop containing nucleoside triphosphate hydrolase protein n=1 Tax=Ilyonectria robusta TaxID=1079257 RepID=UPI001E8CB8B9|nr:P-loop containing nucleoside triphosphate hydrolase protein [Ilyonectria robusta]KAH8686882.1 P-loop containing nucleoside triphosphate hydrolase protein [Ilyonectria robusta]